MSAGRVRPLPLRHDAVVAVISLASAPKPERVEAGVRALEALGYRARLGKHALDAGPLYYAGSIEQRLDDLHWAFRDPEIEAVFCTRGGWGSAELLPHIDRALLAANPKPFVGYSDLSSVHTWLHNELDWVTFYGPMVAADFARPGGVDLASWRHALHETDPWTLGTEDGLRVLRAGQASGTLRGGCLSMLTEALGTPFAAQSSGGILFLEDVGTRPYQWDRMLLHLGYAGALEGVRGIVFGDMEQCVAPEEHALLEGAVLHALRDFAGPIAIGLRCGHVNGANITLPLGAEVALDLADREHPRMHFPACAPAI